MMQIKAAIAYGAAALMLVLLGIATVQTVRVSKWQAKTAESDAHLSQAIAEYAKRASAQQTEHRKREQELNANKEKEVHEANQKLDEALAAARRAGTAADRLRNEVARLAGRRCATSADPAASAASAGTNEAVVLLADVFGRAQDRLRLVDQYADQLRVRLETCERLYDKAVTTANGSSPAVSGESAAP